MLVHLERVGGAEQHHARKHVPLGFEPAVGAFAEEISAERVARADQAGQQHQAVGNDGNPRIYPIDDPAEPQKYGHAPPTSTPPQQGPPSPMPAFSPPSAMGPVPWGGPRSPMPSGIAAR